MYKPLIKLVLVLLLSNAGVFLHAQTTSLAVRNVSGIVRDSLNKPVQGATVKLVIAKDTISVATNNFGFYGFKNVRSAEFLILVSALGYAPFYQKYFQNDTKAQLNIPPIRLGSQVEELDVVTVERQKGPVVKGDTTQFWAKDYIVRDYAHLEDLLRRMEGITIDQDGSVFYNGERVVKALFNGKEYFSGSVKDAIKELPADIVERIQIIDQNKDATGAKQLKSDETSKVLNVVTKADKSAGKMYELTAEQGTQKRSKLSGSLKSIDAGHMYSADAFYQWAPVGIQSDVPPGTISNSGFMSMNMANMSSNRQEPVTDGKRKLIGVGFGFEQKLKNWTFYHEYVFKYTDYDSNTISQSASYYNEGNLLLDRVADSREKNQEHNWTSNFSSIFKDKSSLKGMLKLDYEETTLLKNRRDNRSGLVSSLENERNDGKDKTPGYDLTADYRKEFSKFVNLSVNFKSGYSRKTGHESVLTDVYMNGLANLPDSSNLLNRDILTIKSVHSLRNSLLWHVDEKMKMSFDLQLSNEYSKNDQAAHVWRDGQFTPDDVLSVYNSSQLFQVPVGYRLEYTLADHLTVTPGLKLVNSWLDGEVKGNARHINRFDPLFNPTLSLQYVKMEVGSFKVDGMMVASQPGIMQLNPDSVYSSIYAINTGNPNLSNTKKYVLLANYSKFFAKQQINIALSTSVSKTDDLISTNARVNIDPIKNTVTTVNSFVNVSGAENKMINADITKNFLKLNAILKIRGNFMVGKTPYLSDNILQVRNSKASNVDGSFFLPAAEWLELTPAVRYTDQSDINSLARMQGKTYTRGLYANLLMKLFIVWDLALAFDLSQSVQESNNLLSSRSPFVLNANIERRFFKKKNGMLSFVVMDMARQNHFTSYSNMVNGYTNTLTNPDSRYYLLQFSWRPQVWGRSKAFSGARKGDGSFIKP